MAEPYYDDGTVAIYHGDCREVLPNLPPVDLVLTDPPYGETSLAWDVPVAGWLPLVRLAPHGSVWCFGSLRAFMAADFAGYHLAQDVVWEKHNGSNFQADRFKRVHELAAQFYPADRPWESVYKNPVREATGSGTKSVRHRGLTPHTGQIGNKGYVDDGSRLTRSVIYIHSCQGHAEHPTQKPTGIIAPLLEYSLRPGGVTLDPFAGSGSTLVAAKLRGARAIGIELRERYCEVAARRLAQEVLPLTEAS